MRNEIAAYGDVTVTDESDSRFKKYDYGVWEAGKPRGRVYERGGQFVGYTNTREPGKALVSEFDTLEGAAKAVAEVK